MLGPRAELAQWRLRLMLTVLNDGSATGGDITVTSLRRQGQRYKPVLRAGSLSRLLQPHLTRVAGLAAR